MTAPSGYPPPTSASGHASIGVGIVAILLCWVPFLGIVGLALGVLGMTLAFRALRLRQLGYVADRGTAVAGLVLSTIAAVVAGVMHLIILWALLAG